MEHDLRKEKTMSIEAVRLLELRIKGDRLDEINAEEVLNRRAAAQARGFSLWRFGNQLEAWLVRRPPATVMRSNMTVN
jgi:hypothetical protein